MERPQLKRPKLELQGKSTSSTGHSGDVFNNLITTNDRSSRVDSAKQKGANVAIESDWDDDEAFSGLAFEKVCMVADYSQALANSQQHMGENHKHGQKRSVSERDAVEECNNETDRLKLENAKLMERIKIKEGEVQILRCQLKQIQDAKETERLNNKKAIQEMQTSFKEKFDTTQREYEAKMMQFQSKLKFKDLEVKVFKDMCKQSPGAKVKLIEPRSLQMDWLSLNTLGKESKDCDSEHAGGSKDIFTVVFPVEYLHEGQEFERLLLPGYFDILEDLSVIALYKIENSYDFLLQTYSRLDFDNREEYLWNRLPIQKLFVKDTYNLVGELFLKKSFAGKEAEEAIDKILKTSMEMLLYQKDLSEYLEQIQNIRPFDNADYFLLQKERMIHPLTIKKLVDCKKINKKECGLDSRRILGMLVSLALSSKNALKMAAKTDLLFIIKDMVVAIGNLRKSFRYSGILAGVTLFVNQFLRSENWEPEFELVLSDIMAEVILARPKLDVLTLVVGALADSGKHGTFIRSLCKKVSIETCALYMDVKLKQAMFFTQDACPLKLLFFQIMGLAGIPTFRVLKWRVTWMITRLLHQMMSSAFSNEISWLPTTFLENEPMCFDVMSCFVYLLNSCLKDYINDETVESSMLPVVLVDSCLLYKRILKADPGLMSDNSHCARCAMLLKKISNRLRVKACLSDAVGWILELMELYFKSLECPKVDDSYDDIVDSLIIRDFEIVNEDEGIKIDGKKVKNRTVTCAEVDSESETESGAVSEAEMENSTEIDGYIEIETDSDVDMGMSSEFETDTESEKSLNRKSEEDSDCSESELW